MARYLQLRVHELRCTNMTENRQNIFGISLETDPDSIDLAAIVVDAGEGQVAQAPTTYLGNRYTDGKTERFATPRVIAEIPVSDSDVFPRRATVTLNMAEKDDGAGFDELMKEVARELADELGERVGDELGDEVAMSDIYAKAEDVTEDVIASLLRLIGEALGLGDDPFAPVTLSVTLDSATDAPPAGRHTVAFHEPNPAHKGEFVLTYDWHISSERAIAEAGAAGAAREALKADGQAPPYPRPYRSYSFRKPRKQVEPAFPTIKLSPRFSRWWRPAPIRFFKAYRPR